MKLVNIVRSSKDKAIYKYIDSLLKLVRNISFSGLSSPSKFNYGHSCSTGEGEPDQNRVAVIVRGGVVKIFHFAKYINE